MKMEIENLIDKYASGQISDNDLSKIEALIEAGEISWDELPRMKEFDALVAQSFFDEVKMPSDDKMEELLQEIKAQPVDQFQNVNNDKNHQKNAKIVSISFRDIIKIASILFIGFLMGALVFRQSPQSIDLATLANDVNELKFQMMSSLLDQPVAQERLKAVKLTSDLETADEKISGALLNTLRFDQNINVRLACLEALSKYINDPQVREGLVKSIQYQDSPLVQIRLAEIMGGIEEQNAIQPLQNWLDQQNLPVQFKEDFKEHIQLIRSSTQNI